MNKRAAFPLFLLSLLALMPAVGGAAEAFPTKPVRLIVPYPAGGPNDVLARMIGGKLAEGWSHQVGIDNRSGAGGNIATEVASRAAPDGYTIILPAIAFAVNPSL